MSRILHTQTRKHGLPWFRVLNARGEIAIQNPEGRLQQRARLEAEGVVVSEEGKVELGRYLWRPGQEEGGVEE